MNIAIGADGTGTTFEEIIKAARNNELNAKIVLLFSNNGNALAVKRARKYGIPVSILNKDKSQEEHDTLLFHVLQNHNPKIDLICLTGYLKLIPPRIIHAFQRKIINSHQSLDLKKFGGKGMYGIRVPRAIIKAGLKKTGSTIHFVSKQYDDPNGVIKQTNPLTILPRDTAETLLSRQLPLERMLYIEVIKMFCDNRLP